MLKALKSLFSGARAKPARRADEVDAAVAPAAAGRGAVAPLIDAGRARIDAGDFAAARDALEQAVEAEHDCAEAHYLLGLAHKKLGNLEEARDSLLLATHFRPAFAGAHFQLGALAAASGKHALAIEYCDRALAADPDYAEAWNARGAARVETGDLEAAAEDFQRAIALKPDYAAAHSNLGCVLLSRLDRFEEGAAHIETARRLAPDSTDVQVNWAMLLQHRGRLAEAGRIWDALVERGVDADQARLNRAMVRLKQGEFAAGWADYEARKRVMREHASRRFACPEWRGESLSGRTVLVYAEQGLGDQIMYASCLPDLIEGAGHCVIECAPKLAALFARSFAGATVTPRRESDGGTAAPKADFRVALGSLPHHFRNSLEAFPLHRGYLRADPDKVAAWRGRLAGLPGTLKVGISWRGGMPSTRRSLRSMSLATLRPLLEQRAVDFVSLQYTDCREEVGAFARQGGIAVHHWQEAIDDYDETAALVAALDLVISVQTAVVHLAGALARPVWVMLSAVPEWRYLEVDGRMPWYPTMRLYRQGEPGNWMPVIERVAHDLRQLAKP